MKTTIKSREHLYLELALKVNKEMYDTNEIPFNLYKYVEDEILKKIKYIIA